MQRRCRTKIIATLGPATDDLATLKAILVAGVDLARLNFSHGKAEDHIRRCEQIRQLATELGREVGILADLQGPKIRISRFANKQVALTVGQTFILDPNLDPESGDENQVGLDYPTLPAEVQPGDRLMLDDGRIELSVTNITDNKVICRVDVGGTLSNNKGINRYGGGLAAEAITEKDKADLKTALAMKADYIAISFPRDANDVRYARELIKAEGGQAGLIAKIERREAVDDIEEIILASDAVMVARGDLGVEIGDAAVPGVQKSMIQRARRLNKTVITATQMMESMISNTIPTRAEVSDVANAVLDGTDAVMLSAETATGAHPEIVVKAMTRVCLGAEQNPISRRSKHRIESEFARNDEAIAMAAMYTANHFPIKAIVSLTETGTTTLLMSRIRSGIPIFAMSRHVSTQRKATLYRGVTPIHFDPTSMPAEQVEQAALEHLCALGQLEQGDVVIFTRGNQMGELGGTNQMSLLTA